MRYCALMLAAACCVACNSAPVPKGVALRDGSTSYTFRCDEGWAGCYSAAQKACGSAGYEEVDRFVDGSLSNAGRVESRVFEDSGRDNEVYDESLRNEVTSRVITIRCNKR